MTLGEGIHQFYVFCAFFSLGALLALPYLFAVGLLKSKVLSVLFDAVYCTATVFLLWEFNLETNNGECRFFVFFALFAGIALACATCKSTLDKLSFRLYNLFTPKRKAGVGNGKTVLQKIDGNIGSSNDNSAGISVVHVADNPHTVFKLQSAERKVDKPGGTSANGRIGKAGTH